MGVRISILLFDISRFERELLPAYRSFVQRSDTGALGTMVGNAITMTGGNELKRSLIPSVEVYQEYADVLAGREYYNAHGEQAGDPPRRTSKEDMRLFVDRSVAPALLIAFCVPARADFQPEQDLSGTVLTRYLYKHSRFIEDYLTFAKEPTGIRPEITVGEWSRLFSKEETGDFYEELLRIPTPDDHALAAEINNLRSLMRVSSQDAGLGILMCVL